MPKSLFNTFLAVVFEVSLVDGVAEDKHVVDTDADQQEGHELVHTGRLTTEVVADAEAGSVGKTHSKETDGWHDATAVNWAKVSQEEHSVGRDKNDGEEDQLEVKLDVFSNGLAEALDREEVESGASRGRLPPLELFL